MQVSDFIAAIGAEMVANTAIALIDNEKVIVARFNEAGLELTEEGREIAAAYNARISPVTPEMLAETQEEAPLPKTAGMVETPDGGMVEVLPGLNARNNDGVDGTGDVEDAEPPPAVPPATPPTPATRNKITRREKGTPKGQEPGSLAEEVDTMVSVLEGGTPQNTPSPVRVKSGGKTATPPPRAKRARKTTKKAAE